MLRQPQEDIAMSIEGSQVGETVADSLVELMALMTASPTIRTFKFRTMDGMEKFKALSRQSHDLYLLSLT